MIFDLDDRCCFTPAKMQTLDAADEIPKIPQQPPINACIFFIGYALINLSNIKKSVSLVTTVRRRNVKPSLRINLADVDDISISLEHHQFARYVPTVKTRGLRP